MERENKAGKEDPVLWAVQDMPYPVLALQGSHWQTKEYKTPNYKYFTLLPSVTIFIAVVLGKGKNSESVKRRARTRKKNFFDPLELPDKPRQHILSSWCLHLILACQPSALTLKTEESGVKALCSGPSPLKMSKTFLMNPVF